MSASTSSRATETIAPPLGNEYHLVECLVHCGVRVRAFVRYNSRNDFGRLEPCDPEILDEVEIFTGDLMNPEAVLGAREGCESVLHLAALIPIPYSYRHPREYVAANVTQPLQDRDLQHLR